jgi:DNA (cytosine-5)-methyltransferase 1
MAEVSGDAFGPLCRPVGPSLLHVSGRYREARVMYRVLSLFAGIGGFDLGLERTGGFETVAFCEIDPFCRRVLAKHWPEVPCYDDVRELSADRLAADGIAIDAICGGFPCQDISEAGKRVGIAGERSGLWSQFARLIGELRPRFVLVENVAALARRGLGVVLADLAALGYDAEWDCVGADAVGASQHRARLWLLAYPHDAGLQGPVWSRQQEAPGTWRAPAHCEPLRSDLGYWPPRPREVGDIPGMADGPADRVHRLKALGNGIVPALPELIGRAILEAERLAA